MSCGDNMLYNIERMDELSALSLDLGVQTQPALPLLYNMNIAYNFCCFI